MNINIQSVLQQVVSSAKESIKEKAISLSCKVDSAIPVCLTGKQLLLTHILHGLINDAADHIEKGKITVKAKLSSARNEDVLICFLIAYSGTSLPMASESGITVHKLKKLIEKQGGTFEEATALGLGKQCKFSLRYQYEEAMTPVLRSREYSFIDALWGLGKMFSYNSMSRAVN